ncbi:TDE2508 family outer membrane beta-barrel protein [Leadbettera azotonutricia]|uniref:Outer membrane protein beta-barrel domain-containing protein n=1 Tax=Leadbettera azotonutricia (strain ATCC BAA-888 / DSM 13862 / ZAS-9) TaxID=545695 RepID=F5Y927_LEAAZ|nr:hypothetical protein [Leadbettera azotonutricia]AEF81835.1 hypothetical protein TREAZ_3295 [Leadbettera azotonutricia ZAS-9]
MNIKKIVVVLAAGLALSTAAFAQSNPHSFVSDNTWGLFVTDVDNYMSVNDWGKLQFEKAFGYFQAGNNYQGPANDAADNALGVSGGFSRYIGKTYFGFYFNGNFWDGTAIGIENDGDRLDVPPGADPLDPTNPNAGSESDTGITLNSDIAMLFSAGGAGAFKVQLALLQLHINKDVDDAGNATYNTNDGNFALAVSWGNNFPLSSGAIFKPTARIGFNWDIGKNQTDNNSGVSIVRPTTDDGHHEFQLGLGAAYVLAPRGVETRWWSFGWQLRVFFWPDPYTQTAVASGKDITTSYDGSHVINTFNVSYQRTWDFNERWSAGYGIGGDITLENWSATKDDSNLSLALSPHATAALIYSFASKPFSLNSGVDLRAWNGSFYKLTSSDNGASPATVTTTNSFGALNLTLSLGGTLKPTRNFSLDFDLDIPVINNALEFNLDFQKSPWITIGIIATVKK